MKTFVKYIFFVFSFIVLCKLGISQENFATNISTEISGGEKLHINYDILGTGKAKSFNVMVILTYDGNRLNVNAKDLIGEFGSKTKPGKGKLIIWYFKNDFNGNIDNVTVDIFAYKEEEPQARFKIVSISNNQYAPCEIVFANNSSHANEYHWDFNDPDSGSLNYSVEDTPSHIFKNGGVFNLKLTARNTHMQLENTYYLSIEIKIHKPTTADFSIEGNNQLPPAKVKFVNKSINADVFNWNFGDPVSKKKNESILKDDEHKYAQEGTYTVQLIVKNNFSKLSDTLTKEVIIEQAVDPKAEFEFSLSSEVAPAKVVFKNLSTSGTNYEWDFGDLDSNGENTSEETDAVHTYTKPGNYEVVLLTYAKGVKTPDRFTQIITVKEAPKPPEASFTLDKTNVLGPATIVFTNNSNNTTTYKWDFGDPDSGNNNVSDKTSPSHTYQYAGTFKVVLTATNKDFEEASTSTEKVVITKPVNLPDANFTAQSNSISEFREFRFTNESQYGDKYLWNFGDPSSQSENTSEEKDPVHNFTEPGNYEVVLLTYTQGVKNPNKFTQIITIKEPPKPPEAKFTIDKNNVLGPTTIIFTNNSINATSYKWDFGNPDSGDNNVSDKASPNHTYKYAGIYKVVLTATSEKFNDVSTSTENVIITEPINLPVAKFTIQNNNLFSPAEINFINQSQNANNYEWNFGDPSSQSENTSEKTDPVHTFTKPGNYEVALLSYCKGIKEPNEFTQIITVKEPPKPPVAKFTIENNNTSSPAEISFINQSQNANHYSWDFGDPDSEEENSSTLKNPMHTYLTSGKYRVILTATEDTTGQTDKITDFVAIQPRANWSIEENKENFALATLTFNNTSSDADSFEWNFGDTESPNNTSNKKKPTYIYKKTGTYKVTLTVTNNSSGLTNSYSDSVYISRPLIYPIANFEIANSNALESGPIVFSNTSTDATSYAWDFGDPPSGKFNTSTLINPQHIYEKPGEYKVVLVVHNKESGKEHVKEKKVIITENTDQPVANFEIKLDGDCAPVKVEFINHTINADSYIWNFGDINSDVNTSNDKLVSHNFKKPGYYKITLEARNSTTGKLDKNSKEIFVKSNIATFIKTHKLLNNNRIATSITKLKTNEVLIILDSPTRKSSIIKFSNNGTILESKTFNYQLFDIIPKENNNGSLLLGNKSVNNLLVQISNQTLNIEEPVSSIVRKVYKTDIDIAVPKMALGKTNEVGIIANTTNFKFSTNILFQKTDVDGKTIPLSESTFKNVGAQLATDIIAIQDGGFCLTGYRQKDKNSFKEILLVKIDRDGQSEIKLINSNSNSIGFDIEESYQNGFSILRAKEYLKNKNFYTIDFITTDRDGSPTDSIIALPCFIKKEDVFDYKPTMMKIQNGYFIACHAFNGGDYDIKLFWINKTGDLLLRQEEINRTNDQFVYDIAQLSDGGFLIVGSEKIENNQKAMILKTDPFGKIYE